MGEGVHIDRSSSRMCIRINNVEVDMGRRRAKGTNVPQGGQPAQAVLATVAALAAMLEGGS
jgi:hypothetical protein